jgi:NitT/TauT family transport system ATP-binding protein
MIPSSLPNASEGTIDIRGVGRKFLARHREVDAIGSVSIVIEPGQFVSIVGPSGCGKSTLLNLIAGFITPTAGTVIVSGAPVTSQIPQNLGYIFQKDTLLPWFTVHQNIAVGPRFRGRDPRAIEQRVAELLEIAKLSKWADAYPHQLSGGMRRRVALLMSLACDPQILLLDEPFGALDTHTKTHLHKELLEIWSRSKQTMVLVTHDLDEAITLSNRVVVLSSPPSRVLLDEIITIPHPRDVFSVRESQEFLDHYHSIWQILGREFRHSAETL